MDAKEALEFIRWSKFVPIDGNYIEVSKWRSELFDAVETLRKALEWRTDQPPKDQPIRICIDYPKGYLGESKEFGWMPLPEVE